MTYNDLKRGVDALYTISIDDDVINQKIKETSEAKAYRLITNAIKFHYKPGDFLLEKPLAESLGMSRTPIAIALHSLVSEGILNKMPKKGCYLPNLDPKDAHQAFSVRKILEAEAIRYFARVYQEKELNQLNKILMDTELAVKEQDFIAYSRLDEAFHYNILSFCNNIYLYAAWQRIYLRCNLYTRYFDSYFSTRDLLNGNTLNQHRNIYDAIQTRDEEKTVQALLAHIDHAFAMLA